MTTPARTYNQQHISRPCTPGKRRLSIYWTWSYPWESQRSPASMENRFSTITEVRNVLWPGYETPEYQFDMFLQVREQEAVYALLHRHRAEAERPDRCGPGRGR